jgi:hypothetical protein
VYLYRYNATDDYWIYEQSAWADETGKFTFSGLPQGSYYIYSSASGYDSEYYNNTTDWAAKKTLTLTATKNLSLQPIALKPYPYSVSSFIPSAYNLPETGGVVTLQVKIENKTSTARNFKVWAVANNTMYDNGFWAYYPVSRDPVSLTLLPGTNALSIPFNIPASHTNGSIGISVFGGSSYGKPLMLSAYTSVYKGSVAPADSNKQGSTQHEEGEEIPLRIANDGNVLLKGKVVKQ